MLSFLVLLSLFCLLSLCTALDCTQSTFHGSEISEILNLHCHSLTLQSNVILSSGCINFASNSSLIIPTTFTLTISTHHDTTTFSSSGSPSLVVVEGALVISSSWVTSHVPIMIGKTGQITIQSSVFLECLDSFINRGVVFVFSVLNLYSGANYGTFIVNVDSFLKFLVLDKEFAFYGTSVIQGDGKVQIASGSLTFRGSVGVKNIDVLQNSQLIFASPSTVRDDSNLIKTKNVAIQNNPNIICVGTGVFFNIPEALVGTLTLGNDCVLSGIDSVLTVSSLMSSGSFVLDGITVITTETSQIYNNILFSSGSSIVNLGHLSLNSGTFNSISTQKSWINSTKGSITLGSVSFTKSSPFVSSELYVSSELVVGVAGSASIFWDFSLDIPKPFDVSSINLLGKSIFHSPVVFSNFIDFESLDFLILDSFSFSGSVSFSGTFPFTGIFEGNDPLICASHNCVLEDIQVKVPVQILAESTLTCINCQLLGTLTLSSTSVLVIADNSVLQSFVLGDSHQLSVVRKGTNRPCTISEVYFNNLGFISIEKEATLELGTIGFFNTASFIGGGNLVFLFAPTFNLPNFAFNVHVFFRAGASYTSMSSSFSLCLTCDVHLEVGTFTVNRNSDFFFTGGRTFFVYAGATVYKTDNRLLPFSSQLVNYGTIHLTSGSLSITTTVEPYYPFVSTGSFETAAFLLSNNAQVLLDPSFLVVTAFTLTGNSLLSFNRRINSNGLSFVLSQNSQLHFNHSHVAELSVVDTITLSSDGARLLISGGLQAKIPANPVFGSFVPRITSSDLFIVRTNSWQVFGVTSIRFLNTNSPFFDVRSISIFGPGSISLMDYGADFFGTLNLDFGVTLIVDPDFTSRFNGALINGPGILKLGNVNFRGTAASTIGSLSTMYANSVTFATGTGHVPPLIVAGLFYFSSLSLSSSGTITYQRTPIITGDLSFVGGTITCNSGCYAVVLMNTHCNYGPGSNFIGRLILVHSVIRVHSDTSQISNLFLDHDSTFHLDPSQSSLLGSSAHLNVNGLFHTAGTLLISTCFVGSPWTSTRIIVLGSTTGSFRSVVFDASCGYSCSSCTAAALSNRVSWTTSTSCRLDCRNQASSCWNTCSCSSPTAGPGCQYHSTCSSRGVAISGKCLCEDNYGGSNCGIVTAAQVFNPTSAGAWSSITYSSTVFLPRAIDSVQFIHNLAVSITDRPVTFTNLGLPIGTLTVSSPGSLYILDTLTIDGGSLVVNSFVVVRKLIMLSGSIIGNGHIVVSNQLTISDGTIANVKIFARTGRVQPGVVTLSGAFIGIEGITVIAGKSFISGSSELTVSSFTSNTGAELHLEATLSVQNSLTVRGNVWFKNIHMISGVLHLPSTSQLTVSGQHYSFSPSQIQGTANGKVNFVNYQGYVPSSLSLSSFFGEVVFSNCLEIFISSLNLRPNLVVENSNLILTSNSITTRAQDSISLTSSIFTATFASFSSITAIESTLNVETLWSSTATITGTSISGSSFIHDLTIDGGSSSSGLLSVDFLKVGSFSFPKVLQVASSIEIFEGAEITLSTDFCATFTCKGHKLIVSVDTSLQNSDVSFDNCRLVVFKGASLDLSSTTLSGTLIIEGPGEVHSTKGIITISSGSTTFQEVLISKSSFIVRESATVDFQKCLGIINHLELIGTLKGDAVTISYLLPRRSAVIVTGSLNTFKVTINNGDFPTFFPGSSLEANHLELSGFVDVTSSLSLDSITYHETLELSNSVFELSELSVSRLLIVNSKLILNDDCFVFDNLFVDADSNLEVHGTLSLQSSVFVSHGNLTLLPDSLFISSGSEVLLSNFLFANSALFSLNDCIGDVSIGNMYLDDSTFTSFCAVSTSKIIAINTVLLGSRTASLVVSDSLDFNIIELHSFALFSMGSADFGGSLKLDYKSLLSISSGESTLSASILLNSDSVFSLENGAKLSIINQELSISRNDDLSNIVVNGDLIIEDSEINLNVFLFGSGSIEITESDFDCLNSFSFSGSLELISSNFIISTTSIFSLTNQGQLTIDSGSKLTSSGTTEIFSVFNNAGTVEILAGIFTTSQANDNVGGKFVLQEQGELFISNFLQVSELIQIDSSTLNGVELEITSKYDLKGGNILLERITISEDSNFNIINSSPVVLENTVFSINGTITFDTFELSECSNSIIDISGTLLIPGTINFDSFCPTCSLIIRSDFILSNQASLEIPFVLYNYGSMTLANSDFSIHSGSSFGIITVNHDSILRHKSSDFVFKFNSHLYVYGQVVHAFESAFITIEGDVYFYSLLDFIIECNYNIYGTIHISQSIDHVNAKWNLIGGSVLTTDSVVLFTENSEIISNGDEFNGFKLVNSNLTFAGLTEISSLISIDSKSNLELISNTLFDNVLFSGNGNLIVSNSAVLDISNTLINFDGSLLVDNAELHIMDCLDSSFVNSISLDSSTLKYSCSFTINELLSLTSVITEDSETIPQFEVSVDQLLSLTNSELITSKFYSTVLANFIGQLTLSSNSLLSISSGESTLSASLLLNSDSVFSLENGARLSIINQELSISRNDDLSNIVVNGDLIIEDSEINLNVFLFGSGSIEITESDFDCLNSFSFSGSLELISSNFIISSTSIFSLTNQGHLTIDSGSKLTSSGTTEIFSVFNNAGTVEILAGIFTTSQANDNVGGKFVIKNQGELFISNFLQVSELIQIDSSTLHGVEIEITSKYDLKGGSILLERITISEDSNFNIINSSPVVLENTVFSINGTITFDTFELSECSNSIIDISGTLLIPGTINFDSFCPTCSLIIRSDFTLSNQASLEIPFVLYNYGSITLANSDFSIHSGSSFGIITVNHDSILRHKSSDFVFKFNSHLYVYGQVVHAFESAFITIEGDVYYYSLLDFIIECNYNIYGTIHISQSIGHVNAKWNLIGGSVLTTDSVVLFTENSEIISNGDEFNGFKLVNSNLTFAGLTEISSLISIDSKSNLELISNTLFDNVLFSGNGNLMVSNSAVLDISNTLINFDGSLLVDNAELHIMDCIDSSFVNSISLDSSTLKYSCSFTINELSSLTSVITEDSETIPQFEVSVDHLLSLTNSELITSKLYSSVSANFIGQLTLSSNSLLSISSGESTLSASLLLNSDSVFSLENGARFSIINQELSISRNDDLSNIVINGDLIIEDSEISLSVFLSGSGSIEITESDFDCLNSFSFSGSLEIISSNFIISTTSIFSLTNQGHLTIDSGSKLISSGTTEIFSVFNNAGTVEILAGIFTTSQANDNVGGKFVLQEQGELFISNFLQVSELIQIDSSTLHGVELEITSKYDLKGGSILLERITISEDSNFNIINSSPVVLENTVFSINGTITFDTFELSECSNSIIDISGTLLIPGTINFDSFCPTCSLIIRSDFTLSNQASLEIPFVLYNYGSITLDNSDFSIHSGSSFGIITVNHDSILRHKSSDFVFKFNSHLYVYGQVVHDFESVLITIEGDVYFYSLLDFIIECNYNIYGTIHISQSIGHVNAKWNLIGGSVATSDSVVLFTENSEIISNGDEFNGFKLVNSNLTFAGLTEISSLISIDSKSNLELISTTLFDNVLFSGNGNLMVSNSAVLDISNTLINFDGSFLVDNAELHIMDCLDSSFVNSISLDSSTLKYSCSFTINELLSLTSVITEDSETIPQFEVSVDHLLSLTNSELITSKFYSTVSANFIGQLTLSSNSLLSISSGESTLSASILLNSDSVFSLENGAKLSIINQELSISRNDDLSNIVINGDLIIEDSEINLIVFLFGSGSIEITESDFDCLNSFSFSGSLELISSNFIISSTSIFSLTNQGHLTIDSGSKLTSSGTTEIFSVFNNAGTVEILAGIFTTSQANDNVGGKFVIKNQGELFISNFLQVSELIQIDSSTLNGVELEITSKYDLKGGNILLERITFSEDSNFNIINSSPVVLENTVFSINGTITFDTFELSECSNSIIDISGTLLIPGTINFDSFCPTCSLIIRSGFTLSNQASLEIPFVLYNYGSITLANSDFSIHSGSSFGIITVNHDSILRHKSSDFVFKFNSHLYVYGQVVHDFESVFITIEGDVYFYSLLDFIIECNYNIYGTIHISESIGHVNAKWNLIGGSVATSDSVVLFTENSEINSNGDEFNGFKLVNSNLTFAGLTEISSLISIDSKSNLELISNTLFDNVLFSGNGNLIVSNSAVLDISNTLINFDGSFLVDNAELHIMDCLDSSFVNSISLDSSTLKYSCSFTINELLSLTSVITEDSETIPQFEVSVDQLLSLTNSELSTSKIYSTVSANFIGQLILSSNSLLSISSGESTLSASILLNSDSVFSLENGASLSIINQELSISRNDDLSNIVVNGDLIIEDSEINLIVFLFGSGSIEITESDFDCLNSFSFSGSLELISSNFIISSTSIFSLTNQGHLTIDSGSKLTSSGTTEIFSVFNNAGTVEILAGIFTTSQANDNVGGKFVIKNQGELFISNFLQVSELIQIDSSTLNGVELEITSKYDLKGGNILLERITISEDSNFNIINSSPVVLENTVFSINGTITFDTFELSECSNSIIDISGTLLIPGTINFDSFCPTCSLIIRSDFTLSNQASLEIPFVLYNYGSITLDNSDFSIHSGSSFGIITVNHDSILRHKSSDFVFKINSHLYVYGQVVHDFESVFITIEGDVYFYSLLDFIIECNYNIYGTIHISQSIGHVNAKWNLIGGSVATSDSVVLFTENSEINSNGDEFNGFKLVNSNLTFAGLTEISSLISIDSKSNLELISNTLFDNVLFSGNGNLIVSNSAVLDISNTLINFDGSFLVDNAELHIMDCIDSSFVNSISLDSSTLKYSCSFTINELLSLSSVITEDSETIPQYEINVDQLLSLTNSELSTSKFYSTVSANFIGQLILSSNSLLSISSGESTLSASILLNSDSVFSLEIGARFSIINQELSISRNDDLSNIVVNGDLIIEDSEINLNVFLSGSGSIEITESDFDCLNSFSFSGSLELISSNFIISSTSIFSLTNQGHLTIDSGSKLTSSGTTEIFSVFNNAGTVEILAGIFTTSQANDNVGGKFVIKNQGELFISNFLQVSELIQIDSSTLNGVELEITSKYDLKGGNILLERITISEDSNFNIINSSPVVLENTVFSINGTITFDTFELSECSNSIIDISGTLLIPGTINFDSFCSTCSLIIRSDFTLTNQLSLEIPFVLYNYGSITLDNSDFSIHSGSSFGIITVNHDSILRHKSSDFVFKFNSHLYVYGQVVHDFESAFITIEGDVSIIESTSTFSPCWIIHSVLNVINSSIIFDGIIKFNHAVFKSSSSSIIFSQISSTTGTSTNSFSHSFLLLNGYFSLLGLVDVSFSNIIINGSSVFTDFYLNHSDFKSSSTSLDLNHFVSSNSSLLFSSFSRMNSLSNITLLNSTLNVLDSSLLETPILFASDSEILFYSSVEPSIGSFDLLLCTFIVKSTRILNFSEIISSFGTFFIHSPTHFYYFQSISSSFSGSSSSLFIDESVFTGDLHIENLSLELLSSIEFFNSSSNIINSTILVKGDTKFSDACDITSSGYSFMNFIFVDICFEISSSVSFSIPVQLNSSIFLNHGHVIFSAFSSLLIHSTDITLNDFASILLQGSLEAIILNLVNGNFIFESCRFTKVQSLTISSKANVLLNSVKFNSPFINHLTVMDSTLVVQNNSQYLTVNEAAFHSSEFFMFNSKGFMISNHLYSDLSLLNFSNFSSQLLIQIIEGFSSIFLFETQLPVVCVELFNHSSSFEGTDPFVILSLINSSFSLLHNSSCCPTDTCNLSFNVDFINSISGQLETSFFGLFSSITPDFHDFGFLVTIKDLALLPFNDLLHFSINYTLLNFQITHSFLICPLELFFFSPFTQGDLHTLSGTNFGSYPLILLETNLFSSHLVSLPYNHSNVDIWVPSNLGCGYYFTIARSTDMKPFTLDFCFQVPEIVTNIPRTFTLVGSLRLSGTNFYNNSLETVLFSRASFTYTIQSWTHNSIEFSLSLCNPESTFIQVQLIVGNQESNTFTIHLGFPSLLVSPHFLLQDGGEVLISAPGLGSLFTSECFSSHSVSAFPSEMSFNVFDHNSLLLLFTDVTGLSRVIIDFKLDLLSTVLPIPIIIFKAYPLDRVCFTDTLCRIIFYSDSESVSISDAYLFYHESSVSFAHWELLDSLIVFDFIPLVSGIAPFELCLSDLCFMIEDLPQIILIDSVLPLVVSLVGVSEEQVYLQGLGFDYYSVDVWKNSLAFKNLDFEITSADFDVLEITLFINQTGEFDLILNSFSASLSSFSIKVVDIFHLSPLLFSKTNLRLTLMSSQQSVFIVSPFFNIELFPGTNIIYLPESVSHYSILIGRDSVYIPVSTIGVSLDTFFPPLFEIEARHHLKISLDSVSLKEECSALCPIGCQSFDFTRSFSDFVFQFDTFGSTLSIYILCSKLDTAWEAELSFPLVSPPKFTLLNNSHLVLQSNFSLKILLEADYEFPISSEFFVNNISIPLEFDGDFVFVLDFASFLFNTGVNHLLLSWTAFGFNIHSFSEIFVYNFAFFSDSSISVFEPNNVTITEQHHPSSVNQLINYSLVCSIDSITFPAIVLNSEIICLNVLATSYTSPIKLSIIYNNLLLGSVNLFLESFVEDNCFVNDSEFLIDSSNFNIIYPTEYDLNMVIDGFRCCSSPLVPCSVKIIEDSDLSVDFSRPFDISRLSITTSSSCGIFALPKVSVDHNLLSSSFVCSNVLSGFEVNFLCHLEVFLSNISSISFHFAQELSLFELEFYGLPAFSCLIPFNSEIGKSLLNVEVPIITNYSYEFSTEIFSSLLLLYSHYSTINPYFNPSLVPLSIVLSSSNCLILSYSALLFSPSQVPFSVISLDYSLSILPCLEFVLRVKCFDQFGFVIPCLDDDFTLFSSHNTDLSVSFVENTLILSSLLFSPGILDFVLISSFNNTSLLSVELTQFYSSRLEFILIDTFSCDVIRGTSSCSLFEVNFLLWEQLPYVNISTNISLSEIRLFSLDSLEFSVINSTFFLVYSNPQSNLLFTAAYSHHLLSLSLFSANCSNNRILFNGYCSCLIGQYLDTSGNCLPCPLNSWSNSLGVYSCTTCVYPRITLSTGSNSEDSCICPLGFLELDGSCLPCPKYGSCGYGDLQDVSFGHIWSNESKMIESCPVKFTCSNNQCQSNMIGSRCNICPDNRSGLGVFCNIFDNLFIPLVLFIGFILIGIVHNYYLLKRSKRLAFLISLNIHNTKRFKIFSLYQQVFSICPLLLLLLISVFSTKTVSGFAAILSWSSSLFAFDSSYMFMLLLLVTITLLVWIVQQRLFSVKPLLVLQKQLLFSSFFFSLLTSFIITRIHFFVFRLDFSFFFYFYLFLLVLMLFLQRNILAGVLNFIFCLLLLCETFPLILYLPLQASGFMFLSLITRGLNRVCSFSVALYTIFVYTQFVF
ncbi:hypothetical protein RCL1_004721 [Eukaryota sp. TZLM3-RCL]